MKYIIEYDENDPNDVDRFKEMLSCVDKLRDMQAALETFSQDVLRRARKYGSLDGKELSEAEHDLAMRIEELFYKTMRDYKIEL